MPQLEYHLMSEPTEKGTTVHISGSEPSEQAARAPYGVDIADPRSFQLRVPQCIFRLEFRRPARRSSESLNELSRNISTVLRQTRYPVGVEIGSYEDGKPEEYVALQGADESLEGALLATRVAYRHGNIVQMIGVEFPVPINFSSHFTTFTAERLRDSESSPHKQ